MIKNQIIYTGLNKPFYERTLPVIAPESNSISTLSSRDLRNIFIPVNMPASPLPDAPTTPTTPTPDKDVPTRSVPLPANPQQDPDGAPSSVPCPPSECPHPR